MPIELKPCPFCGGKAFFFSKRYAIGKTYNAYCGNEDCAVGPRTRAYFEKEKAAEAWNRRADNAD